MPPIDARDTSRYSVSLERLAGKAMSTLDPRNEERRNLEHAIAWVHAIERGATGDELSQFVTADVIHEDMPNRVFPNGMRSDLARMREAAERGKALMRRQRYDIVSTIASGNAVAMQLDWTGELAVSLG